MKRKLPGTVQCNSKRGIIYLLLLGTFIITSCNASRMAFSPDIIEKYALEEEDLEGLLFYTGNNINLMREVDSEFRQLISNQKLVKRKGRTYEIIKIPKGTVGILSLAAGDSLKVSFARQKDILFVPHGGLNRYISATSDRKGHLMFGNEPFICKRPVNLAIQKASYKKFGLPRYFAEIE